MPSNRIQTGIRFEEVTLEKLKYIAAQNRRSLNLFLELLAEQCIEEYEKENGEIVLSQE